MSVTGLLCRVMLVSGVDDAHTLARFYRCMPGKLLKVRRCALLQAGRRLVALKGRMGDPSESLTMDTQGLIECAGLR